MDKLAQQMLAFGFIILMFFVGLSLVIYINEKFGGKDE